MKTQKDPKKIRIEFLKAELRRLDSIPTDRIIVPLIPEFRKYRKEVKQELESLLA